MSNDDFTQELEDGESKATQPTITAVFRLLKEVKLAVDSISARLGETNARLDETNARLDETNARLDETNARLDEINARLDETNARLDETNARLDETNARLDETNARLDATNTRLGEVELRLSRDLTVVDARLSEKMEKGFGELGDKIDALNRGRLHTDAEQSNLLRRIRELESKAS